jgi:hypothetical protein
MLPSISAVAMPEPIRPPPMTAAFLTFLGFSPISVTPGICQKRVGEYVN